MDGHPNQEPVCWPKRRTDDQQAFIDEHGLEDLPDALAHEKIVSTTFIGVPGETMVYEIGFEGNERFPTNPSVPMDWLHSIQEQGWEIAAIYTGIWQYKSNLRWHLSRIRFLQRLVGTAGLKVRLQYRDTEGNDSGESGDSGDVRSEPRVEAALER